jgi:hypothetical protein
MCSGETFPPESDGRSPNDQHITPGKIYLQEKTPDKKGLGNYYLNETQRVFQIMSCHKDPRQKVKRPTTQKKDNRPPQKIDETQAAAEHNNKEAVLLLLEHGFVLFLGIHNNI